MDHFKPEIITYLKERGWDDALDEPANLAKSLMIECAELLEHFQWQNFSPQEIQNDAKKYQEVRDELADILIYTIQFAESLDINMEQAVRDKMEKVKQKYPVDEVKDNCDNYFEIKKAYRGKEN